MEPVTTTTAIVGASAWFGNKLLGPTIDIIGADLKSVYEKGKDRIVVNAIKKTKDIDAKGQTNLRVTRDVFWNGSFTDEAICAEYFGGILASSRSTDGKDDSGVFYVDIIKSLSSGQLKMHYIIYRTLNKFFLVDETKRNLNPGLEQELMGLELFVPLSGIIEQLKDEDPGAVLHAINAKNLISNFQTENYDIGDGMYISYLKVVPKTLGIQLYAIANNNFPNWRNFSTIDFGDFDGISLPKYYGLSLEDMLQKIGIKKKDASDQPKL